MAARSPEKPATTLLLIALFKLFKAALLLAAGIGALRLLHGDASQTVDHWVRVLRVDPDNRFIHKLLARVTTISPKQLKEASAGTFIYAGLLLTEGVGLLLRKHWAEYFTIITTAAFIPLEVYEISRHVSFAKIIVLLVNLAIVAYLLARIARRRATKDPKRNRR